ncbi:TPA: hypothetical protein N0F65_003584 [Lagenidium giganteum]|uniref:COMM domain-containing protein n=1 Tax=Lagenidium giganteum TaxID=4803 RepID=A0AAV2Z4N8_9STRA|nr:TPA: hypothetical protein N0F65_003584 [Lagenidium giganteum]
MASELAVLNDVVKEKLPHVLAHILDKIAVDKNAEIFAPEEHVQLQTMLSFTAPQIDAMTSACRDLFIEAADFGMPSRASLAKRGLTDEVIAVVEKGWRKKGRAVTPQLQSTQITTPLVLRDSTWRLHLEMGQSKLSGVTKPVAIFQTHLADHSGSTISNEKLEFEMNHSELFQFFQQLNAIQAALDQQAPAA